MTHTFVQQLMQTYCMQYPAQAERLEPIRQLMEGGNIISRANMQGHVTASLLVLNPEKTHVLTIYHKHLGKRLNPGGHIDEEGDPFETAVREGEEEVGLPENAVMPLYTWDARSCALDLDVHPIGANAKKSEGAHFHHDIVYATVLKPGVELCDVDDSGVEGREWTPLEEWGALSSRNTRMLGVLQESRYGIFA